MTDAQALERGRSYTRERRGRNRIGCCKPPIVTHRSTRRPRATRDRCPPDWARPTKARHSPHARIRPSSIAETVKGPLERRSGSAFHSWNGPPVAPASGWLARAERLLDEGQLDCAVRGIC